MRPHRICWVLDSVLPHVRDEIIQHLIESWRVFGLSQQFARQLPFRFCSWALREIAERFESALIHVALPVRQLAPYAA
jgi:hypothetical protein